MVINKVVKLVPKLYDKKNYVVHIRALNQALGHGLIIEKVHHVIEFKGPIINYDRGGGDGV